MAATKKTRPAPPQSTLILMVRHGQTPTTGKVLPGRAAGLHLAEAGVQQAHAVAERIAELPRVDAIYASPLERARETAAPIGKALQQRVKINKGLLECDFGDWTGEQLSTLMKKPEWSTVQRAPSSFRFPNGESFTEMQTRMVTTLDNIRQEHPGGVVVCLGSFAYEAVCKEWGVRPRPKFGHGVEVTAPDGTVLICSFHPSQQNTFTGKLTEPMLDAVFSRAVSLAKR